MNRMDDLQEANLSGIRASGFDHSHIVTVSAVVQVEAFLFRLRPYGSTYALRG